MKSILRTMYIFYTDDNQTKGRTRQYWYDNLYCFTVHFTYIY